jgi:hypothetical protein
MNDTNGFHPSSLSTPDNGRNGLYKNLFFVSKRMCEQCFIQLFRFRRDILTLQQGVYSLLKAIFHSARSMTHPSEIEMTRVKFWSVPSEEKS